MRLSGKMGRKQILDYLIYLVVRLAICTLQSLTMNQCRALASWMAWLAYRLDRRHREIALENLRRAFPGRHTGDQRRKLVQRVYRHFALMIAEIAHAPRKLHGKNYRRYVTLRNVAPIIRLIFRGQPVVMLSGHFGNWEMAGYLFGILGFRSHSVIRPLDNPYLDRFLRRFREGTGQTLIPKKGGIDQIQGVLGQFGGLLCLLADQDAGRHGIFVDYFGMPASTHKAIALLALQHSATVITGGALRVGDQFHYEVFLDDVIAPEEIAGSRDELRALTQRFTTSLEHIVRTAPDQYLWLHRRWKTQPGVRRRGRRPAPGVATAASR